MNRPQVHLPHGSRSGVSTPSAACVIELLGAAQCFSNVSVSKTEYENLQKLYSFKTEGPTKKPPAPVAPKREDFDGGGNFYTANRDFERAIETHKRAMADWNAWTDPRPWHQAGADRNMARHMEHDGLRIVAWLAKYVDPGEDPLKVIIRMMGEAGYDVDPEDTDYASDDHDDDDGD